MSLATTRTFAAQGLSFGLLKVGLALTLLTILVPILIGIVFIAIAAVPA